MYIKTKTALVNLRDKDIVIRDRTYGDAKERFIVTAEWSSYYEGDVQAAFDLYEGPEKDCQTFLQRLTYRVSEEGMAVFDLDKITGGLEQPPMVLHEPKPIAGPKSEDDIPF